MHPASCAVCLKMEDDKTNAWDRGTPFVASYTGPCADMTCRHYIEEGHDIVRWTQDDLTAYTHEGCSP